MEHLLRIWVAVLLDETVVRVELLATGALRRREPPPSLRIAVIDERSGTHQRFTRAVARGPHVSPMDSCVWDVGKTRRNWHAEKTVGQAVPEETFIFEESLTGTAAVRAGAAAENTVSLTDVATRT